MTDKLEPGKPIIGDPSVRDQRHLRWTCALDNYEPTREYGYGNLTAYTTDTVTDGVLLFGADQLRDSTNANYLLDDGVRVRPYYVAGWMPEHEYIIIHPFPVNHVTETGHKANFDTWMLGPRRTYHLKTRRQP